MLHKLMTQIVTALVLTICLSCLQFANAQGVGTCSLGSASGFLNINNVNAELYNNGHLFWRGSGNTYEVPKGEGVDALFAAGLWFGGIDHNDQLRFAGTSYGPFEYWPGPLDDIGNPPVDCSVYNRIFVISQTDVDAYDLDGTTTADLLDWPVDLGAGVVDGDGIEGNYDLAAGDRPEILGDQTAFWVMNDGGELKSWSGTLPMGLEVQVSAYAFAGDAPFSNTTFYRYRLINKGSINLEDAYVGFWADTQLGEPGDDYVGSDTLLHTAYTYNENNLDVGFYGVDPPALGISVLDSPIGLADGRDNDHDGFIDEAGEKPGLSSVITYLNDTSIFGNPEGMTNDAYYYLQGRDRAGELIREGGAGTGRETTYFFPGNPLEQEFWSEENYNENSDRSPGSDRKVVVGSGPFDFSAGDTTMFEIAIVWSRSFNRLASVTQLREDIREIRASYADTVFVPTPLPVQPVAPRLISPPDASGSVLGNPSFSWEKSGDSLLYALEVSQDAAFGTLIYSREVYDSPEIEIVFDQPGDYFWRVKAIDGLVSSEYSEARSFTTVEFGTEVFGFTNFLAVANASGPLDPPKGAAADFQGFPVPERPDSSQQVGPGTFLIHTGDNGTRGPYESFVGRSIRNGWDPVNPWDWEIRITEDCHSVWRDAMEAGTPFATPSDGCYAYDRFGIIGPNMTPQLVPFELWNIGSGTPADTTDDYRVVPVIIDWDADGFDMQWFDHSVSSGDDDPETDWFYWYNPCDIACVNDDMTPGSEGHDRWKANLLAGSAEVHGEEVMGRFVFVNWNGGSVNAASDKADFLVNVVNQDLPEVGTVFRLVSEKPLEPTLVANLSGQHPGGGASSAGAGVVEAIVRNVTNLTVTGSVSNLENGITSAGLYAGALPGPGELLSDLVLQPGEDLTTISGTAIPLTQQDLPDDFRMFVKIETEGFPEGELVGQLLIDSNQSPVAGSIQEPTAGSTVDLVGLSQETLAVSWTSAGDPDGNALYHSWQLGTDPSFTNVIAVFHSGPNSGALVEYGDISDALLAAGFAVGTTVQLHQRLAVSDGSIISYSISTPITFEFGIVVGVDGLEPIDFALQGNYPNPFTGETTIVLDLPEPASVEVEVFDLLGRRVNRIVEDIGSGRERRVSFKAAGLASGIYLYRVRAKSPAHEWIETDRMVVVK